MRFLRHPFFLSPRVPTASRPPAGRVFGTIRLLSLGPLKQAGVLRMSSLLEPKLCNVVTGPNSVVQAGLPLGVSVHATYPPGFAGVLSISEAPRCWLPELKLSLPSVLSPFAQNLVQVCGYGSRAHITLLEK